MKPITLVAECACCGKEKKLKLTKKESELYMEYLIRGSSMGMIQDLFPRVPAWIRSCCIDQRSNSFGICPECSR
jgi:hypothetical protein